MIRTDRRGFTLIELAIVVLIMGILARIALPTYQNLVLKARAVEALADINTVRLAAYEYNADTNQWPDDVNRGVVPPELQPYLGPDFSFEREHYHLDWDNWTLPDGSPQYGNDVLLGVSMATQHAALGNALVERLGGKAARFTIDEHYTFVVVGKGNR